MAEVAYFFDSFAVVEMVQGSPAYSRFASAKITITLINLAEIYWVALRDLTADEAERVFSRFRNAVVDIDDETLKEAVQFRLEHKRKDLSYADCIGYIFARRHGMLFLTGDKEFAGMDGVEFVK